MTRPIIPTDIPAQPLWDPRIKTFVAKAAVTDSRLRRCRISDYVLGAILFLQQLGHLRLEETVVFEDAFLFGGRIRSARVHAGLPFRAPDDTIMIVRGQPAQGDTMEVGGPWDFTNVHLCQGYDQWMATLRRGVENVEDQGEVNAPVPVVSQTGNGLILPLQ
jgi:hypothetical protein